MLLHRLWELTVADAQPLHNADMASIFGQKPTKSVEKLKFRKMLLFKFIFSHLTNNRCSGLKLIQTLAFRLLFGTKRNL